MTNVWKKVVLQAPIWQGLWKAGQMEFGDGSSSRRLATHFVAMTETGSICWRLSSRLSQRCRKASFCSSCNGKFDSNSTWIWRRLMPTLAILYAMLEESTECWGNNSTSLPIFDCLSFCSIPIEQCSKACWLVITGAYPTLYYKYIYLFIYLFVLYIHDII